MRRPVIDAAHRLRRALEERLPDEKEWDFLASANGRYSLNRGLFETDVQASAAHVKRARDLQGPEALLEYERALALYRGPFLDGDGYQWIEPFREAHRRRFIEAAREAAWLTQEGRDATKATALLEQILEVDATDEASARDLMRLYARCNDLTAVRKVYRYLCESLRRELSVEPAAETARVYHELTEGRS